MKFSIAFKATAIYTTIFGLLLAAAVGVLSWAVTVRAVHMQRLDNIASFVEEHLEREQRRIDFESFAKANRVYIEVRFEQTDRAVRFGEMPAGGGNYADTVRRIDRPGKGAFVRVVDCESTSVVGNLSVPGFLVILSALLLLAAVYGAFLMRKMMRPIYDMTCTARSISASDLSKRIDTVHSHDELKELAETFNEMLDRIQASYEQQNQFVSDASHELRTPLSVISGYANLLRRWGSGDAQIRDESVAKIVEETENMRQLVERLLFLARADQKTQPIRFERFNVSGLVQDIAEDTELISGEHFIVSEIEPDVFLTADPDLIKQAVRAVLENSMHYTPSGGTIRVSCRRGNGCVEIEVADTGIGIAEKDLPYIFDRFYKADAVRSREAKESSGLGLSIVKWIIERHSGEIRVESKPGTGTKIRFILPEEQNTEADERPA